MSTIKLQEVFVDSKDLLFDLFKKNKIKKVEVGFDGAGDSGQIEYICIDGNVHHSLLEEKLFGAMTTNGRRFDGKKFIPILEEAKNVREVIDSVCYEALEMVAPGWENNDGCMGVFEFDTKTRKVQFTFNRRITDFETTEYDI